MSKAKQLASEFGRGLVKMTSAFGSWVFPDEETRLANRKKEIERLKLEVQRERLESQIHKSRASRRTKNTDPFQW